MAVETPPDEVLGQLVSLATEARSADESIKSLITAAPILDNETLTGQLSDLYAMVADLSGFNARAHTEHFTWAEDIEAEIDELKDPSSALVPEDAQRLKGVINELLLAVPAASDDLRTRATEALAFIDEVTIEDADDDADEEDGDDEEETE